eukprot:Amastigsp_a846247_16.p4 type:complete len:139 gc:universal Amastigsp_a846247_16:757-1173(+)
MLAARDRCRRCRGGPEGFRVRKPRKQHQHENSSKVERRRHRKIERKAKPFAPLQRKPVERLAVVHSHKNNRQLRQSQHDTKQKSEMNSTEHREQSALPDLSGHSHSKENDTEAVGPHESAEDDVERPRVVHRGHGRIN